MTQRSALVALMATLYLAGCGGGGGSSTGSTKGHGTATLQIDWPDRSRSIPVSANSLVVSLSQGGKTVARKTVDRPGGVAPHSTVEFDDVPEGDLQVALDAYPSADGVGTPQATGSATVHVSATAPATIPVSLASTATSLAIVSTSHQVGLGNTLALSVSAHDAEGRVVLLATVGASEPIAWSSSDSSVVSLTGSGATTQAAGLAEGTATVGASLTTSDSGAAVSDQIGLSVLSTGGSVIVK